MYGCMLEPSRNLISKIEEKTDAPAKLQMIITYPHIQLTWVTPGRHRTVQQEGPSPEEWDQASRDMPAEEGGGGGGRWTDDEL